ncbi:hypothetical protein AYO21_10486 [Fonsecaea monophora]|uniref:2-dehydropantoate 2-reductase n=1 Tax=Fonsecaea monophora TaxID=254056 RepID=A0A177EUP3_9EURO|nr:hypothetical protein AYO21_10486 [Fonsecaea monophora]OAG35346.1 hypothetical protein AYO21_10486 [Fonsecaea monophora]
MAGKANVLLVGSGGVGTMGVYALESGGQASVTAVLRSNYAAVVEKGFSFDSVDHGKVSGWKPTAIVNAVPAVQNGMHPFDFIVVTTKNIPDVPPTVAQVIAPAVTPGHTVIVLVQNGLNIEHPVQLAYPTNIVLSGISHIGAKETTHGHIWQNDPDRVFVGPFTHPTIPEEEGVAAAKRFVEIYNAGGKVQCKLDDTVTWRRWRKLMYNASYNPVCAITQLDSGRLRLSKSPIDGLIRPLMHEVVAVAGAHGVELDPNLIESVVNAEAIDDYFEPSMMQDVAKGNLSEYENILGEPLRAAQSKGVEAPTLKLVYELMKALQWRTKERKGIIKDLPLKRQI